MRASRLFAPSIPLVCLTIFVAACAQAPATEQVALAPAPNTPATFDAGACQKGEYVSVKNGESYPVLLRAETKSPSATADSASMQDLGWLPAGHSDVLINLRPNLDRVLALPDSEHGRYDASKSGTPARWPTRVEFGCVVSSF